MDRKIKNSLFNIQNYAALECLYVDKFFQVFVEIADQNIPNCSWTSASNKGLYFNSISQFLGFIAFRQAQFILVTMLGKIHFKNSYTNRETSTHYPKMLLCLKTKKKRLWFFKVLYHTPFGICIWEISKHCIYKIWNPVSVNIFKHLMFN